MLFIELHDELGDILINIDSIACVRPFIDENAKHPFDTGVIIFFKKDPFGGNDWEKTKTLHGYSYDEFREILYNRSKLIKLDFEKIFPDINPADLDDY